MSATFDPNEFVRYFRPVTRSSSIADVSFHQAMPTSPDLASPFNSSRSCLFIQE
jgi:hypothetical protein